MENCPAEALVYGNRRELITEARKRINENPEQYIDQIYGEHEAGGTGFLYLSPVPFNELGFNTSLAECIVPVIIKRISLQCTLRFCFMACHVTGTQGSN